MPQLATRAAGLRRRRCSRPPSGARRACRWRRSPSPTPAQGGGRGYGWDDFRAKFAPHFDKCTRILRNSSPMRFYKRMNPPRVSGHFPWHECTFFLQPAIAVLFLVAGVGGALKSTSLRRSPGSASAPRRRWPAFASCRRQRSGTITTVSLRTTSQTRDFVVHRGKERYSWTTSQEPPKCTRRNLRMGFFTVLTT